MIKYIIKSIIRFLLHVFWILPVNNKKVFFSSFKGTSISCNPYYIYKELEKHNKEFHFVWCFNGDKEKSGIENQNVKYVKFNSFSYIINLITSKILINNASFPSWIPFRNRKQIIINTWHGGGAYKRVAVSEINSREIQNRERITSRDTSYFISSSKMFTDVMIPSVLVPKEKFLNIGMPRNDIFFNSILSNQINLNIRKQFNILPNDFVILYAPTYRESSLIHSNFNNELDILKVKQASQKRFGKNIKILFRGHYFFTANNTNCFDLDVSSYPNMQDLLCMADMLLTDYSSSMWDFSFTKKPCFLFCPDLDDYYQKRGFYTNPLTWGFPICKTNDDLSNAIIKYDSNQYNKNIQQNHDYFVSYETGNATKSICEIIYKQIF